MWAPLGEGKKVIKKKHPKNGTMFNSKHFFLQIITFFRPIFKLHFFFSAIRIEMIFFIIMAENLMTKFKLKRFFQKKIIAKKSVIKIFNVISYDTEKTLLKVSFESS